MKIVLSGSAGIGKTTFIDYLKSALDYPIIPDFIDDEIFKRGYKGWSEINNRKERRDVRLKALERKILAEKENRTFLSDKGVVDYLAYWLIWDSLDASFKENKYFLNQAKEHTPIYKSVIIPHFGKFKIENNKLRTVDESHQFRIHSLIKGIYLEFGVSWRDYSLNLNDSPKKVLEELGINP